jgi:hypothetical protein
VISRLFEAVVLVMLPVILLVSGCKTTEDPLEGIYDNFDINNKFEDSYKDFIYFNSTIGMLLEFDGNWQIDVKYDRFSEFSKTYAGSFNSNNGEVIFVGRNTQKKIGVRCTAENLDMEISEYFDKLKSQAQSDVNSYNIQFEKSESATWKNLSGTHVIMTSVINKWNKFTFDSMLFSGNGYIIKIDFWIDSNRYEENRDYIQSLYNTIDFVL